MVLLDSHNTLENIISCSFETLDFSPQLMLYQCEMIWQCMFALFYNLYGARAHIRRYCYLYVFNICIVWKVMLVSHINTEAFSMYLYCWVYIWLIKCYPLSVYSRNLSRSFLGYRCYKCFDFDFVSYGAIKILTVGFENSSHGANPCTLFRINSIPLFGKLDRFKIM